MNLLELLVIAVGVSMDAFAISICKGLSVQNAQPKHLLINGLWFGGAQAIMPLLGFVLGSQFSGFITRIDHWLSFFLSGLIGINMILESRKEIKDLNASFAPKVMLPLAIADSIDALAVGVSFAFLRVDIFPAVILIGICTFLFSACGVKIGNVFGSRFKSRAEVAGGVILILMGIFILLEHLGYLA